jgi:hypothetical protein
MKKLLLFIPLLLITINVISQQRDLDYYLDQAKTNSPLINRSRNESKIVSLDMEQFRRTYSYPSIRMDADVLLAPIVVHAPGRDEFRLASEDISEYNGYDLAATDGGQYQAMIIADQPLFGNSKVKTYSDKVKVSVMMNDNNILLTEHELEQAVQHQYILCLESSVQRDSLAFLTSEISNYVKTMQSLVSNAVYQQTDLLLLQIEYQNYALQYESYRSEYINNLYDLNLICGIHDTTSVELTSVSLKIQPEFIGPSVFLAPYRLDSLNIMTDQAITEFKYRPEVGFFANAGLNSTYLPSLNRLGFSAGITFSWSLYDGNQRKIQRQITTVNLQNIAFEKSRFEAERDMHRDQLFSQIVSIDRKISLTDGQLRNYNILKQTYIMKLSGGDLSIMDLKNLLESIAEKQSENISLHSEKQALINMYNYWNY